MSSRTQAWRFGCPNTGYRTNGGTVGRRRSRLEVWLPGGYLAVVLGIQIWVEVLSRTGDAGFAGVWTLFATAPFSVLALLPFVPGAEAPTEPPDGLVHTGPEPPTPLPAPSEMPPPPPADWSVEPSAASSLDGLDGLDAWTGFGLYGAIVVGALMNATLLWGLVRVLAGRRSGVGRAAQG
ncbi:SCO4225 family membrane protein [Streptomyces sp. NPDC048337]|uniref:SCO4225 family membrane protein n=1 Tax=Streptomyces sp. NPDC048337 TaxID=3365535 RepID=UPI00371B8A04